MTLVYSFIFTFSDVFVLFMFLPPNLQEFGQLGALSVLPKKERTVASTSFGLPPSLQALTYLVFNAD